MAVQMRYARLARNEGRVAAERYQAARDGDVCCTVCRTPVAHTSTHKREHKSGRSIIVPAYFHLPRGGEHRERCPYDPPGRVRRLVADSQEILDADPKAIPLLIQRGGVGAEFRLHVLMEVLDVLRRQQAHEDDGLAGGGNLGNVYVRTAQQLATYLRTARGILALAAALGRDPSLERLVRIISGGVAIPWADFFFEADEHSRLWGLRRRLDGRRPVAVLVRTRDERALPLAGDRYRIRCWFEPETDAYLREFNLQVVLDVRGAGMAERIQRHQTVAVCGIPHFTLPDFDLPLGELSSGKLRKPFGYITIAVEHLAQVHRYRERAVDAEA